MTDAVAHVEWQSLDRRNHRANQEVYRQIEAPPAQTLGVTGWRPRFYFSAQFPDPQRVVAVLVATECPLENKIDCCCGLLESGGIVDERGDVRLHRSDQEELNCQC